jgi:3-oxoacyl-[acyl-carrier protein] reductase
LQTGLEGKGVLVTGASGGIGAACARAFAAEGARVAVHYHRGEERARDVAAALGGAPTFTADLTDEIEVERLFREVRAALGRIDVCAAVAGVWPADDEPVWELSLERWERTLRQNATSVFLTARGFLQEVARNGHGSLVLVGSTAGLVGEAGHADYAAAKSAVTGGLLLSLKNEIVRVAPAGRVNAVAPGWTESPMTRGYVDPEQMRLISRTMALRKVARAEDVARQVVVLASDELSGHVTGQVITVAGGMEGRVIHDS